MVAAAAQIDAPFAPENLRLPPPSQNAMTIVATATTRVKYGAEALIEQGVRFPDANKRPEIWRIAVTPQRS